MSCLCLAGACSVPVAANRSFFGAGGDILSTSAGARVGVVGAAWVAASEAA